MNARERRKRRRTRIVWIERGVVAVWLIAMLCGVGALIYFNIPGFRLSRQLNQAESMLEASAYDEAIVHCREALKIDSTSIEAYHAMAGAYWSMEDKQAAELTLQEGFEATQDDGLLQEYCVYMLNDAVADINSQSVTYDTWEKCVEVLETSPENQDVYAPLTACYEWLLHTQEEGLFTTQLADGQCSYDRYAELLRRMLRVYEQSGQSQLKDEILRFATVDRELLWMEVPKLSEYLELFREIEAVGTNTSVDTMIACLEKALWAQDYFSDAFTIFESGEYAPIRDFMQEEAYVSLRDQFMDGEAEYWSGETYIPISRERMKLMNADGCWSFSFADFEEYPQTEGVINLWAAIQRDDGVQRLCISYEPKAQQEDYYPHTTLEFIYLYSNVTVNGQLIPKMNYRFETRVATKEGTTTQLIGDWGGANEWTTTF